MKWNRRSARNRNTTTTGCPGHGINLHVMTDEDRLDLLRQGSCPRCPGGSTLMVPWHPAHRVSGFAICSCCSTGWDLSAIQPTEES